jgi:hypothetical protein
MFYKKFSVFIDHLLSRESSNGLCNLHVSASVENDSSKLRLVDQRGKKIKVAYISNPTYDTKTLFHLNTK